MTRHFARPVFTVSLHVSKQNLVLLRTKYYVIAKHRFAVLWQSPGRAPCHKPHARYFCTCVEKKAQTRKRVSVIVRDNVILKAQFAPHRPEGNPFHKTHARYFCTCVEKKAHASKRVSIIACNNVISKAQCAPIRHKLLYGTFATQRH